MYVAIVSAFIIIVDSYSNLLNDPVIAQCVLQLATYNIADYSYKMAS